MHVFLVRQTKLASRTAAAATAVSALITAQSPHGLAHSDMKPWPCFPEEGERRHWRDEEEEEDEEQGDEEENEEQFDE